MDENQKQSLEQENLPEQSATDAQQADAAVEQTQGDSTFSVEKVESEEALDSILNEEASDAVQPQEATDEPEAAESEAEDADEEEVEQEITLATYAADCESCATKVYFELDDLDDEGNLLCPNCNECIEIDNDAIDYYLVEKKAPNAQGDYVVDCEHCEAVVHFRAEDIDDEENIVCNQCGEKIHIDTEVLDAYKEADTEKKLKQKRIIKRVLYSLAGVVLGLAVCCAIIWFAGSKSVVKVDGTSVPMNIYSAVYYIDNASNYIGSGFNVDEKPSKQEYTMSNDFITWDDFLRTQTEKALKLYYGIYNQAKAEGYELNDQDKENIESAINSINTQAAASNVSFEQFLKNNYGLKMNEKDFRPYLELTAYVNSYYKEVMKKDVTEEQLEKIYTDNPENYEVVTFRYFYVQVNDTVDADTALKNVEAVAQAKDEQEFIQLAKEYAPEENKSTYEEDNATLVKDMACVNIVNRPVSKLLTDASAEPGQTVCGLSEDETYAEAALLVTPRHKSDELIMDTAINEVASKKGQEFIEQFSENTQLKSSIGSILREILY